MWLYQLYYHYSLYLVAIYIYNIVILGHDRLSGQDRMFRAILRGSVKKGLLTRPEDPFTPAYKASEELGLRCFT